MSPLNIPLLSQIVHTEKELFCADNKQFQDKAQEDFYNQHVKADANACLNICLNSLSQSGSDSWMKERRKRVTASQAHKLLHGTLPSIRKKYFIGNNFINRHMRYGIETEDEARAKYMQVTGHHVIPCGLMVKPDQPWISASPDGLFLTTTDNTLGVLEIKCPSTCRNRKIDVKYLDKSTGNLKPTHWYYTQVQIQMYVTGAPFAHFFVYSSKDYKLVSVPFDKAFLQKIVPKLDVYYFTEFLNTLV